MAAIRVLLTVEDSESVVESAVTMSAAPQATPDAPPGFIVDPTFPAVPIAGPSTSQTLQAMTGMVAFAAVSNQVGHGAYVVRGVIDEQDLVHAINATQLPDGTSRIFADPEIAPFPTCGNSPPLGTALDLRRLLGAGRLMQQGMDGSNVALVIVDSGVNLSFLHSKGTYASLDTHASWTPSPAVTPGHAAVGHGTMCAYDALLMAPRATLFDCAVLTGNSSGGSPMSGTLSNAIAAYGKLLQLMMLHPDERHFHSMVVSNSWGMYKRSWDFPPGNRGRFGDNPSHPFNIQIGSLASAGADILFAAGNCGPVCPDTRCDSPPPPIFLANSHPDVLCVAGVDTSGAVVGYSSRGPGVLGNTKPDLATYTHFLGSEVFGPRSPDSGTSAACPVMAGVVAALRTIHPFDSANPRRAPANLRAFLTSSTVGGGGWQPDLGSGIVSTLGFPTAGATL